jgi:G3E family GTPase
MIPLVLVTGFLGSGKTTLLRRIAERKSDLKLIYLVNEFSPQDVDARLLEAGGLETVSIAGGSIFCQCRVTEFIQHLTMIPERFGANGAPVAGVVVEASGIADPLVIRRMLAETRLDETYGISAIVTVVDPKSFLKLVRTLPNILAQVEAADWVILNKIDQCSPEEIRATETEIERVHPGAEISKTSFCEGELEWLGAARDRSLTGEYAPCADPNYARLALRFRGPVDLRALETALRRAGDAVFRVKGFARVESGTAYVDYSAAGFHAEPKEAPHTGLECIVSAPRLEEVRAILADLPGTAID